MKRIIAAALIVTVLAAQPAEAATLEPGKFAGKYHCWPVTGGWVDGFTQALWDSNTIKTSVFVTAADGTALVRQGTNKATIAAITSEGDLRLACARLVPFGTRVAWS